MCVCVCVCVYRNVIKDVAFRLFANITCLKLPMLQKWAWQKLRKRVDGCHAVITTVLWTIEPLALMVLWQP